MSEPDVSGHRVLSYADVLHHQSSVNMHEIKETLCLINAQTSSEVGLQKSSAFIVTDISSNDRDHQL
jgi:hypothetical protein